MKVDNLVSILEGWMGNSRRLNDQTGEHSRRLDGQSGEYSRRLDDQAGEHASRMDEQKGQYDEHSRGMDGGMDGNRISKKKKRGPGKMKLTLGGKKKLERARRGET